MSKTLKISLNAIPILAMIGLIPLVANDYLLAGLYIAVIVAALLIRRENKDLTIFIFGFFIMIISEYIFTSTHVEVFVRNSLFGLMPLWLPLLWGYGFIAIKRLLTIMDL